MTEQLQGLPMSARIQFKLLFLGLANRYLWKRIRPLSLQSLITSFALYRPYCYRYTSSPYAISDHQLRSLDRTDLLVFRSRMSTSQQRAFIYFIRSFIAEFSPCTNSALIFYMAPFLLQLAFISHSFPPGTIARGVSARMPQAGPSTVHKVERKPFPGLSNSCDQRPTQTGEGSPLQSLFQYIDEPRSPCVLSFLVLVPYPAAMA